jgi:UDP-N-acetylmuramoyl-tripeptide--D-alanyl-D-alanine ligase
VAVLGPMKELGGDSEKLHFHLGAELGRFNLDRVMLIGEETKDVREGALSAGAPADRFVIYPDMERLEAAVEKEMGPGAVVLFKGSRSAQLEKAVEFLFRNERAD